MSTAHAWPGLSGKRGRSRTTSTRRRAATRTAASTKRAEPSDADDDAQATSLTLSSERLGVVARIDRVELRGGEAVPVETSTDARAGRVPIWAPELAQIAVQTLLLREHGHNVAACRGVLPRDAGTPPSRDPGRRRGVGHEARRRDPRERVAGHAAGAADRQPEMPALLARRRLPARRDEPACPSAR